MSWRLLGKTAPFLQHGGEFLIRECHTCQRGVSTYDKLEVGHASVGMEDWFNDRVTGQQFKFQINLGLGGHHGPIDSKRSEDLAERGLFLGCLSLGKFFSQAVQVNVLIGLRISYS